MHLAKQGRGQNFFKGSRLLTWFTGFHYHSHIRIFRQRSETEALETSFQIYCSNIFLFQTVLLNEHGTKASVFLLLAASFLQRVPSDHYSSCGPHSLQVDNLRLELHKARAQCRALEKASSHAAVFEQYDRELTALRCQVRELRRENEEVRAQYETQRASATRFGGTLQQATSASVTSGSATKTEEKGGANSDSSSKDSETSPFEIARDSQLLGQSQSASQSVKLTASSSCGNESRLLEMLQRQVKQSRVDKEGLERELAATRHESRHVTIQKRAAEDAIGRGESMSR